MSTDHRMFVAVFVPPDAVRDLHAQLAPLREAQASVPLRFTPDDKLHLTLRFMAKVPPDQVDAIAHACEHAAASSPSFELALCRAGAFPTPRRATVLWLGPADPAPLVALGTRVNTAIDALGLPPEVRPLSPHLTIARCRRPQRLDALIDRLACVQMHFRVAELALVRSHLGSDSPRYEILRQSALGR